METRGVTVGSEEVRKERDGSRVFGLALKPAIPGLAAAIFVIGLSLALTYLLPRPFYILDNDYDNGHYYNIRSLRDGLPVHNVEHPGTPVFYLGRVIMTESTARPENVQEFLNRAYLVVGFLTAGAVLAFYLLALTNVPLASGVVVLASLATWPPFFAHLNQFCTESFILPVGLLVLGLFSTLLSGAKVPRPVLLAALGGVCGLSLAIKITFAPLVLAVGAATGIYMLRMRAPLASRLRGLLIFSATTVAGFVICIYPVLHRVDEMVFGTLRRRDVKAAGSYAAALAESMWALMRESPVFVLMLALAIAVVIRSAWLLRRTDASADGRGRRPAGFDVAAGLVFLGVLLPFLLHALASSAQILQYYSTVGHSLRNASPSALILPFVLLMVVRARGGSRPGSGERGAVRPGRVLVVLALAVVGASTTTHLLIRDKTIRVRSQEMIATSARLGDLRNKYGSVAFWDGSPSWKMGAVSFHFWGSYRYAKGYFDDELLRAFPGYMWLHLRDIPALARARVVSGQKTTTVASEPVPAIPAFRRPYWKAPLRLAYRSFRTFKRARPAFPAQRVECYSGETRAVTPGLFALPAVEASAEVYSRLGWSHTDLRDFLATRYGPLEVWTETIAGCEWVFFARTRHADAPSERVSTLSDSAETRFVPLLGCF